MSLNNTISPGDFQYTPTSNITTLQNVFVPQSDSVQGLLLELRNEIKSLRTEVSDLKQEIKDMKVGNVKVITKLTEEVIAVKLENRKHHIDPFITGDLSDMQQLPFAAMADLIKFDEELQNNEDKLMQFKQFIAKTGGEGYTQFIRAAIRKVFSDELASAYSWKGTSSKPSAEKCFIVTTIKNICHGKFKSTDKDMNIVLQKHFVHAKDRLGKRKRVE